jgi:hypothetical protein
MRNKTLYKMNLFARGYSRLAKILHKLGANYLVWANTLVFYGRNGTSRRFAPPPQFNFFSSEADMRQSAPAGPDQ